MGALILKPWIEGKDCPVDGRDSAIEEKAAVAIPISSTLRELRWRWKAKTSKGFGRCICGFSGCAFHAFREGLSSQSVSMTYEMGGNGLSWTPVSEEGGFIPSEALLPCTGLHYLGDYSVNAKHVIANSPFSACLHYSPTDSSCSTGNKCGSTLIIFLLFICVLT